MDARTDEAAEAQASNRSMIDLFSRVVDQMAMLFQKEIELAKAEAQEKMSRIQSGVARLILGAVLLIPAVVILLQGAVAWIAEWGLDPRWGFLIVGLAAAVVGWALLQSGLNSAKRANLTPRRTINQLSRDAAVAREQVR